MNSESLVISILMMIRRAFSGTEAAENCEVLKRGSLYFFAEDPGRQ